jgi:hypothetical protein
MVIRQRATRGLGSACALLALLGAGPPPLQSQLRPLEPLPWHIFDPATSLQAGAGVGVLSGQRASLAGTEGTLREIGNLSAAWRSGRIALEAGGTVRRTFHDRSRFGEPHATVTRLGPRRADSGDFSVGTMVRLTPLGFPALAVVRFGTRLPNSDDHQGLDRDRTDFYATVGAQLQREGTRLGGEAGIGIFGSHDPDFEQADPLVYALTAEQRLGPGFLDAAYLGHRAGFGGWVQRGNESLSELRLGGGFGTRQRLRVRVQYVHGLSAYSPASGWLVSAGIAR